MLNNSVECLQNVVLVAQVEAEAPQLVEFLFDVVNWIRSIDDFNTTENLLARILVL